MAPGEGAVAPPGLGFLALDLAWRTIAGRRGPALHVVFEVARDGGFLLRRRGVGEGGQGKRKAKRKGEHERGERNGFEHGSLITVMAGHGHPEDGVASHRLFPGHPRLACGSAMT